MNSLAENARLAIARQDAVLQTEKEVAKNIRMLDAGIRYLLDGEKVALGPGSDAEEKLKHSIMTASARVNIFPHIHTDIVAIVLTDGTLIERRPSELIQVPPQFRKAWNLEQVEERRRALAQRLQPTD